VGRLYVKGPNPYAVLDPYAALKSKNDCKCESCQADIPKGSNFYWSRGDVSLKKGGVGHARCEKCQQQSDPQQYDCDHSAAEEEVMEAADITFGLERDLQLALRANIEQLEKGLKVGDGGKEQPVESGRIDITAEDRNGSTVVIELKAGTADREAVAQTLSYMGDLGQTKKSVRGILIAGDFTPRARAAARAVPNLSLKTYAFKFSFASMESEKK
jgi:RecB family endonuclease NucS